MDKSSSESSPGSPKKNTSVKSSLTQLETSSRNLNRPSNRRDLAVRLKILKTSATSSSATSMALRTAVKLNRSLTSLTSAFKRLNEAFLTSSESFQTLSSSVKKSSGKQPTERTSSPPSEDDAGSG